MPVPFMIPEKDVPSPTIGEIAALCPISHMICIWWDTSYGEVPQMAEMSLAEILEIEQESTVFVRVGGPNLSDGYMPFLLDDVLIEYGTTYVLLPSFQKDVIYDWEPFIRSLVCAGWRVVDPIGSEEYSAVKSRCGEIIEVPSATRPTEKRRYFSEYKLLRHNEFTVDALLNTELLDALCQLSALVDVINEYGEPVNAVLPSCALQFMQLDVLSIPLPNFYHKKIWQSEAYERLENKDLPIPEFFAKRAENVRRLVDIVKIYQYAVSRYREERFRQDPLCGTFPWDRDEIENPKTVETIFDDFDKNTDVRAILEVYAEGKIPVEDLIQ